MTEQKIPTAAWFLAGGSQPNPKGKPNQDALHYTPHPLHTPSGCPSALALVCDGVGGQPGGEAASALAVETLGHVLEPSLLQNGLTAESQQALLDQALAAANEAIFRHNQALGRLPQERMTTTIVVAWLYGDRAVLAHVGDSRAYAFTPDQGLARLTTDHTAVELDLRRGLITPEQAHSSEYHGGEALTQALGQRDRVSPDFHRLPLRPGLILMLCSDGVYKPLGEERLAQILGAAFPASPGAKRPSLLARFLARAPAPGAQPPGLAATVRTLLDQVHRQGGKDDASMVLVQVVGREE